MTRESAQPANAVLADRLEELAALLRATKADRFRIRAYERAAAVVRAAPVELETLDEAEIARLSGIGAALGRLIAEYLATGSMRMLDELRAAEPAGFGDLLRLPLIGVRDARLLAGTHGFTDIEALQRAADTPGGLDALGEKLVPRVREALRRLDTTVDRRLPLPLACRDADALAGALRAVEGVDDVVVAGSVRRSVDTVGSFDLVVVTDDVAAAGDAVAVSRPVVRVVERNVDRVSLVSTTGRPADVWLATTATAGAAAVLATGGTPHVAALQARAAERGVELRSDGVWRGGQRVAGASEHEVYAALDLTFVPPELREDAGEIEAAMRGELPALVSLGDLRGDLHVHTDWSGDGKASADDMVGAARARGYDYVAITDHAENLRINGMSREKVAERRAHLAQVAHRHPDIRILDAAELNIGLDGSIDYDLEFLLDFDMGVASVHSHMDRPTAQQTDRILAAIGHPAVHVIGHMTGRILGRRPAYGVEMTAIAQAAAETGTALEVNGSPRRLDLCGEMVRTAVMAGALIATSSDAHSISELDYVQNAVPTARRGWAAAVDVLNARTLDQLLGFVERKKNRSR